MKRHQHCDNCGERISHGFPRRLYLYCSQPCMMAHGRTMSKAKRR